MASRLLFLERDTRRPVAISNESTPATATDAPRNCDDPAPGGIGTVADHGPPLAVSKSRLVAGLNSEESSSVVRPVVSICLAAYNGAKHLPECVESILAQTHSDFELVIVDDCSPDDSAEIAKRYARLDSRVKVFVNDSNLGLVGNWNGSVSLSHGEWIKFVFQDDLIRPECLRRMLAVAASSKMPIVSFARDFIFEPGTTAETRQVYLDHQALIRTTYRDSDRWSAQGRSGLATNQAEPTRRAHRGPPTSGCLRSVRPIQPSSGVML